MLQRVSFVVAKRDVLGVLHLPEGAARGGAVVLHGFGGHPDQAHIVGTCAALAAAGVAALRFAYRDHLPPRMTLASALEDARGATTLLRAHPSVPERLGVVGFSFGGAAAALLAGRERSIRALVLAGGTSDGDGELQPLRAVAKTKASVLLLWGTNDTIVSHGHADRYAMALGRAAAAARVVDIEGADHDFGPTERERARMASEVADFVAETLSR